METTTYELETTDFINDIIGRNINDAPYESDNEEEFEFFNFAEFEGLVNGEWDTIPNEFHSVKEAMTHCKQYEAIRLEESRRN